MCCYHAKSIIILDGEYSELSYAGARRVLQHGLEYRRKLAGRRTDDAQNLRRGGLLIQRTARNSLSSRVFSMAMTAWAAKFSTSTTLALFVWRFL